MLVYAGLLSSDGHGTRGGQAGHGGAAVQALVLVVGVEEELAAGHLGAQLYAGQEGAAQLAVQGVRLLGGGRQPVLQRA